MAEHRSEGVTVDDVLSGAKELIVMYGWERQAWPLHGPRPRCIRAALQASTLNLQADHKTLLAAQRRVSEAIHNRRGVLGGILDYEHRKATNRDSVIAILQKAIEIGPAETVSRRSELWPV